MYHMSHVRCHLIMISKMKEKKKEIAKGVEQVVIKRASLSSCKQTSSQYALKLFVEQWPVAIHVVLHFDLRLALPRVVHRLPRV